MHIKRVFLIVLDSFGIGWQPDAHEYGDEGSNTLKTIRGSAFYHTPNLRNLGLFSIDGVEHEGACEHPFGAFARMEEQSKGKDTTIGHWEIGGIVSKTPLPTFPNGFPLQLIKELQKQTGREIICNKVYSGTEVLKDYGKEQMEKGALIVYTSSDSVLQIAAHEAVVPLAELYECCQTARKLLVGSLGVGRVIARPFVCKDGNFVRTTNRHDFSLFPPKQTMLDVLRTKGFDTIAIGKIHDIFAGRGISKTSSIQNNEDGMAQTIAMTGEEFTGLCFVNLVDFDMLYGHRNNIDGYGKAATAFDVQLLELMQNMKADDLLIITADHGCDPGTKSTDHSREYTPMLAYGKGVKQGVNLGTRKGFGDIAATILEVFSVEASLDGISFWDKIKNKGRVFP